MKLQKAAHTICKTQYHIVWVTRYRRKILVKGVTAYLQVSLQEVQKFHPDWFLEEVGIKPDYVHFHMVTPQKYAVTRVVNVMKSSTSKPLKQRFPDFLQKVYWDGGSIWSQGFFVSTVGINEAIIQRYIREQGK